MLRGENGAGMDIGMCEFYERIGRGLAGEVWVDVLHRKMPGIWAKTVENTPPYISVKKSAIFYDGRILGESGAIKAGLN